MKMSPKNNFSKINRRKDVIDILNSPLYKKESSKAKSSLMSTTAYSECMASVCSDSDLLSSSRNSKNSFSEFMKKNPETFVSKCKSFTRELDLLHKQRIDELSRSKNRTMDILNYKYSHFSANNYIINFLPRFKTLSKFNKYVQDFYENEINLSPKYMNHANKINVAKKKFDYKLFLYQK